MVLAANRGSVVISQQVRPFAWSNFDPVTRTKVITIESGLGSLTPDTISPWSTNSIGPIIAAYALAIPTSATYPQTNRAHYIPFAVSIPRTVYQMYAINGAAVSGNIDVGIYSEDGTRLVSMGATAQAGVGVIQFFDIANTELDAGLYYMAVAMNNTTGALMRTTTAVTVLSNALFGIRQEGLGSATLPATWTPVAATATVAYIPLIGLTTRSDFI